MAWRCRPHHWASPSASQGFALPGARRGAAGVDATGQLGRPPPRHLAGTPSLTRRPRTARLGEAAAPPVPAPAAAADAKQLSSVPQSVVNLVKNIVGSGMFSLPAGVAAFSASPKALVPALTCTLLLGLLSAYGFVLIADACQRTGETTYQGAWSKTVGRRTSFLPVVACTAKAGIGCISFSMILGDCLSRVFAHFGFPPVLCERTLIILALEVAVVLPLCSMKSLAPLAKFSAIGVLSNVYISCFVLFRWLDGSYRAGGALAHFAPRAPQFASFAGNPLLTANHPGFAVVLSILSTAFLAHYNAPLFYEQLAPAPDGKKGGRFLLVSVLGFSLAGAIFALVMAGGFLTFGSSSLGLILNNYAARDDWAILGRLAIAMSLITAYPIVFFSLRKQVIGILGEFGDRLHRERPILLNIPLLAILTAIALSLRDLGKLAAFAGACFGSFLIYIAPALMVIRAQQRGLGPRGSPLGRALQFAMVPLGVSFAVLGARQVFKR